MKKVACIGSREISAEEEKLMERIGAYLVSRGFIIKSGNALGSDQAYARGANRVDPTKVELYLPWPSYEKQAIVPGNVIITKLEPHWYTEAAKYHPVWDSLKPSVRNLMARNIGIVENTVQVIARLNHQKPGGGGTGHGVRYSYGNKIPVLDLATKKDRDIIISKLGSSN